MTPCDRVREVLAVASRLADPSDPLGQEARRRLPGSTGLSPEGVAFALATSLEVAATDEELDALLASVSPAPRVVVVLSANVFTAASRAIALARASSAEVLVRASRREPVFAELLVRGLEEAGARGVSLVSEVTAGPGDHVHVYGRDDTLAHVRDGLPAGARLWGHGAGLGVIALDGDAETLASCVARDIVLFDQRGCLSPRIAFVATTEDATRAFAARVGEELEALATTIPLGEVTDEELAARVAYLDAMTVAGDVLAGFGWTLGVDLAPRALLLPAPPRVLHVARVTDAHLVRTLLGPWARLVTTIGGHGPLAEALATAMPWARISPVGAMQRPPLDGPVDRRTPAPRS